MLGDKDSGTDTGEPASAIRLVHSGARFAMTWPSGPVPQSGDVTVGVKGKVDMPELNVYMKAGMKTSGKGKKNHSLAENRTRGGRVYI
jgi:hypothetical protein